MLKEGYKKSRGQEFLQELKIVQDKIGFMVALKGPQGISGFTDGSGVWQFHFQQAFSYTAIYPIDGAAKTAKGGSRCFLHSRKPVNRRILRNLGFQKILHCRGLAVA